MVINLSDKHSLISNWVAEIRDTTIQMDRMRFRRNLERIGEAIAYEISKTLPFVEKEIQTPFLIPLLAWSRENGRGGACSSTLKQMGLGVMQYARDYDELFPRQEEWAAGLHPYLHMKMHCPSLRTGGYAFNKYSNCANTNNIKKHQS